MHCSRSPVLVGLLAIAAGFAGILSGGTAANAASACEVPDDAALRARSAVGPQGWRAHETWLAEGAGPAAAAAIGEALKARFGTDTKTAPHATLAAGLIGATRDHSTRQLVVVVDPALVDSAALLAATTARLASAGVDGSSGVGLRVQGGCRSSAALLKVVTALSTRSWVPQARTASYGFHVNPADSTVDVTFGTSDTVAAQALRRLFGESVEVSYGNPARDSRLTDGEPHWGGAAIGYQDDRFCTAGFIVRRNSDGQRGGVTAGHCFANGEAVYSGSERWGTANGESNFPLFDQIRVTSSTETYERKIHVDPCCPSVRTVTARSDPPVGTFVCLSGYVTRAICGLEVTRLDGELCDASGCTTSLIVAVKPGETVRRGGDSGGPMYTRPTSSTARIRGMHIGGPNASTSYAEKVSIIEAHLGVTVVTS